MSKNAERYAELLGEPDAHMFPDDLEKFQESETFAQAYSIVVGSPDGKTEPLYRASKVRAILDKALAVREGWQLVPKEPTVEMREALQHLLPHLSFLRTRQLCKAMLEAAPKEGE